MMLKEACPRASVFVRFSPLVIRMDEEGGLFDLFFSQSPDELRAHAIWSMGHALKEAKEEIPAEVTDRVKLLWQHRLAQA